MSTEISNGVKDLVKLFKLIELTRAQTQYGYLLHGIQKSQLSNLAEHHYLVTFMGWQLATKLKAIGAQIDVQKVMEFCLIHDLGELMGGDISGPYAKVNKKARKFAKAFEEENQKYLAKFFGSDEKLFKKNAKEILDAKSDEALVAKVADYIECTSYMVYVNQFTQQAKKFNSEKITGYIRKIKDKTAKKYLSDFLNEWIKNADKVSYIETLNKV